MKKDNNKNIFSGLKIKKKHLSQKEKKEMLDVFMKNIEQSELTSERQNTKTVSMLSRIILAASVIGIVSVLALKYIPNKTILAPKQQTILLSDNTSVTLRKGASLSYSPFRFLFSRNVELSGEAFFNVQKKGAFSVISKLGTVKVLGTEFAIETTPVFKTQCYSGMVEVQSNQTQETELLHPGVEVVLNNGKLDKRNIQERIPQWVHNRFVFENQKLSDVISILGEHYHIKITGLSVTEGLDFTGSFPADDLSIACQLVFGPYGLKYQINGDTLDIIDTH